LYLLLQSSWPEGRHVSGLSPALALGHLPCGANRLCPIPARSAQKAALRFRPRSCGSGIMGTVYDLMNENRRHAAEITVDQRAEERRPECPDGDLPKLGGRERQGPKPPPTH